jgi:hypothetical protein
MFFYIARHDRLGRRSYYKQNFGNMELRKLRRRSILQSSDWVHFLSGSGQGTSCSPHIRCGRMAGIQHFSYTMWKVTVSWSCIFLFYQTTHLSSNTISPSRMHGFLIHRFHIHGFNHCKWKIDEKNPSLHRLSLFSILLPKLHNYLYIT